MALPPLFVTREAVKGNCFSKHDNRHAFQNSGVYFGQGLGKRPVSRRCSQHTSDNHTSWTPLPATNTCTASTYGSDFCHRHHSRPPLPCSSPELPQLQPLTHKFQIFSKPTFHRFPHSHLNPHLPQAPPLSRLAAWYPYQHPDGETPSPTSLAVLAESQRPFLSHNPWVYSYRS